jgi:CRISPR system Cascade subunit CasB
MMEPKESARPEATAVAWWRGLQATFANGERNPNGDRATLARLRRCATVAEAMQEPATIELFRNLGWRNPIHLPKVALTAAVLASVREAGRVRFARAIGPESPAKPETALVKPLRFRRLMESDTGDERLTAFRRAVALAGGVASLSDLAAALLDWSERRRVDWIFEYWNAADHPPVTSAEDAT